MSRRRCGSQPRHEVFDAPDEIKAWLRTPKEMMAKKGKTGTKPTFGPDKISDKDLDDLATYLSTLK